MYILPFLQQRNADIYIPACMRSIHYKLDLVKVNLYVKAVLHCMSVTIVFLHASQHTVYSIQHAEYTVQLIDCLQHEGYCSSSKLCYIQLEMMVKSRNVKERLDGQQLEEEDSQLWQDALSPAGHLQKASTGDHEADMEAQQ